MLVNQSANDLPPSAGAAVRAAAKVPATTRRPRARRCSNWVSFTRTAFEVAIRARAEALVETISRALAGVPAAAGLQAIVLTGGSTQIPLLQRLLGRAAGGPLEVARFAAARGAAILAALAPADVPAGTAR